MAVFYNREKSKIGTLTGSIINWAYQLDTADPEDGGLRQVLPPGYLRCDGAVYQAEVFPLLAEILGTGSNCRYKKPDVTLLDNQFQVPDLGSKAIKASNSSNLGDYLDTYLTDDANRTITKSGIGLEVQSNIGSIYEIQYQGNFFIPSQSIEITGQPGFTRSTGNYTEETEVLSTAFQPHAHFHDGKRTRVAAPSGNEYATFGRNSYTSKSTLCIMPWANNTYQPLCRAAASRQTASTTERVNGPAGCFTNNNTRIYYGACWSGCTFDASYECLIPGNIPGQGTFGCAQGGNQGGFAVWHSDSGNCGNIRYTGEMDCYVDDPCIIGPIYCNDASGLKKIQANYTPDSVTQATQVPFDSSPNNDSIGSINNVTTEVEEYGNECLHKHAVPFNQENHTFVVRTRPAYIPATEIVSTIRIDVNEENKADGYIQPYLVQEFLIKY